MVRVLSLLVVLLITLAAFADDLGPPAKGDPDGTARLLDRMEKLVDRVQELEEQIAKLEAERNPQTAPPSVPGPPHARSSQHGWRTP